MQDERKKKFNLTKDSVLKNMDHLLNLVDDCQEFGMVDNDAGFYNHVMDVRDLAETAENYQELVEAIVVGKEIEQNIDAFLVQNGISTRNLSWPDEKVMESEL